VAAIPGAAGAQGAPRGVTIRALLRVVVLGSLVLAGWLLGSGTAQADEDVVVHKNPVQENLRPPEEGSHDLLGAPPTVRSTIAGVVRAVPVPRLPVQPAQVPVLKPVSQLAAPGHPVTASTARSKAAARKPAVVPPPAAPVEPAIQAAVTAPAPVLVGMVSDATPETPICLAAHPVADPLADRFTGPSALGSAELGPSALDRGPAAPVPASPFGSTTAPCPAGSTSTGGGATTLSGHSITLSDGWATTAPSPTRCRLCAGASSITPSAAQRPSTSPD
jgi:hypothetical protein